MDLLKPTTLKELCARAGMRPEKSSGQNFLVNRVARDRIVAAVDPQPADTILEVGAGFGVLTCALAPRVARVIAIERDRHITPILREFVEEYRNVEIVEGDVLRWLRGDHAMSVIARSDPSLDSGQAPQSRGMCTKDEIASVAPLLRNDTTQSWKLAANLPYSITSDFLRLFFDAVGTGVLSPPERAVLLLQREVVDRLTADPQRPHDRKQVGMLTILTQLHCVPRRVANVAPGSFWPAPRVESAVVVLDAWRSPEEISELLGEVTREQFLHFVHATFARRRAQIGRILRAPTKRSREDIERLCGTVGIDPATRPETLTLENWTALARLSFA